MKRRRLIGALISAVVTLATVFVVPASASAATVGVGFRAGSWHCPNGVHGISKVVVTGTDVPTVNMNGTWEGPNNTQTAIVTIRGVPANGGKAHVVVTSPATPAF
jgi:hypothetical protein